MSLFSLPLQILAKNHHSIFIFHKVPKCINPNTPAELELSRFEFLLDFISENFKVIPLEESPLISGNRQTKAPYASITFDDGYPDWVSTAAPALLSRQLPATFFITTGQLEGKPLWHERIIHAITNSTAISFQFRNDKNAALVDLPLRSTDEKIAAIVTLENFAKYLPLTDREHLIQSLEEATFSSIINVPTMPARDIRQLHSMGFGIGTHTVNHPILTCCDQATALHEIATPRETLASITAGSIHGFAYPNGIPNRDFTSEHIAIARKAGYRFAVTTNASAANSETSPFQLPRFTPWGASQISVGFQLARNLFRRTALLTENKTTDKKILMVAFHFPPQAGSSGVQRTLNFVKHLPKFGCQPTVLTAVETAYESTQPDLLKSLPVETKIIRAFALDTARHLSVSGKYLRLMAIPDRWFTWSIGGILAGLKATRQDTPDLIWSTYPLATANLIAAFIAKQKKIPWVADFRDPMIISDTYPPDPWERWAKKRIEAMTMRNATRCVFTTQYASDLYQSRYSFAADKCFVIPNGFDNDAFKGINPTRDGVPKDSLLLLHSGVIYPKERDPSTFFLAVAKLIETGQLLREKTIIRFRGASSDGLIKDLARKVGVDDILDLAPSIPFREAIAEMAGADVLLVFQGSQFNPQVPAKIYEYLRTGTAVLGILDHKGNAASELRKFSGTVLTDILNPEEIAEGAILAIQEAKNNTKAMRISNNQDLLYTYSREAQTQQLAQLLHRECLLNKQWT